MLGFKCLGLLVNLRGDVSLFDCDVSRRLEQREQ